MIDRGRAIILVGETARDAGILVLVFAPLDALFQSGGPGAVVIVTLVALALISVAAGIMIETWQPRT